MKLDKIKDIVEALGSDSLKVVGGKYEGGAYLQQIPDEISPCIHYLLQEGKFSSFLEIGSASGGNVYLFNLFFKFDNIVIIDDNLHKRHTLRKRVLKAASYREFVGNSHSEEALDFIRSLGIRFDILFIDGDHTYKGVKKDTDMYLQFVNDNGFVIYHDTVACAGIRNFVSEAEAGGHGDIVFVKEFISETHGRPCGIGLFQRKAN